MEQDANQGKGPTYSKEQAIYMLEFIGRVRRVLIGSVFAVVALVFLLVFQPMQAELRKSLTDGFAQMSRANHYVIENAVERRIEGAESLSSRTIIKNAIREYKSGKMSLEELKTYTQPKYEDGARAIDQVCLAHRVVDDETVALYQVGELCPDISCADIGAGQGSEFMPRIITKGERAYAAMNAPIIIENATVGHDFVVYDMTEQIKALSTISTFSYTSKGNSGVWNQVVMPSKR